MEIVEVGYCLNAEWELKLEGDGMQHRQLSLYAC